MPAKRKTVRKAVRKATSAKRGKKLQGRKLKGVSGGRTWGLTQKDIDLKKLT